MARTLSKTGINNGQVANAWHVTQSIDALTGTEAYDITISGSLDLEGNLSITGFPNVSASLAAAGGGGGSVNTGSLLTTASVSSNIITFTKGNGDTFPITVSSTTPTLQQVVDQGSTTTTAITASAIGNTGQTIRLGGATNFIDVEDGGDSTIDFRGGETNFKYSQLFFKDDEDGATIYLQGSNGSGNVRMQFGDPEFESTGYILDLDLANQSANFNGLSVTSSLDIEATRTIQGESGSFKRIVGKDITGITIDPGSGQTQLIGDIDITGRFGLNATGVTTTFGGTLFQFTNTQTIFQNNVTFGDTTIMDEVATMKDSHQSVMLTQSLSSAGDVRGDIIKIGNTATTAGMIYYLSASAGQPEWYLGNVGGTDLQTSGSINNLIGVALGTNSTTNGMLLKGIANHGLSTGGQVIGQKLFLNSGGRTNNISSPAGSRIIGYWTGGQSFYFDPEKADL